MQEFVGEDLSYLRSFFYKMAYDLIFAYMGAYGWPTLNIGLIKLVFEIKHGRIKL